MLVLTRKARQQIQIGSLITLKVLKIKGASVQLGIDAPRNIKVMRRELSLHDEAPMALPLAESAVCADPELAALPLR